MHTEQSLVEKVEETEFLTTSLFDLMPQSRTKNTSLYKLKATGLPVSLFNGMVQEAQRA